MDLRTLGDRAVTLFQQGHVGEAEKLCAAMLGAEPRNFLALHLRGLIRLRLGRLDEAAALLRAALEVDPRSAQAHANLGNILAAAGSRQAALAAYDRALGLAPQAQTYCNRANVLAELARHDAALKSYDEALARDPALIEALLGKSNLLQRLGRFGEAVALCDLGLGRHPADPRLLNNRAVSLCGLHRYDAALADCDRSLALRPGHGATLGNRADALSGLGRWQEALAAYDAALAADPRRPETLVNRGHVLRALGRGQDALADVERALALAPDHALALLNRGIMLSEERRFPQALASLETAMAADPAEPHGLGLAVNAALELCDWERSEALGARLMGEAAAHRALVPPLVLLGLEGDKSLQLSCARAYLGDRLKDPLPSLAPVAAYRHPRIRLAYVSSDLRAHPVAAMIIELLEGHDRARFEVIGISTGEDDSSAARRRFEKAFDRFVDARDMDDEAVARAMRAWEVDIAIDLNGHTRGARPGILARRPAPVQAAYLGYAATTGADFIDYVIADATVAPMADQPFFSERIVHLPDTFWTSDRGRVAGPTPSRAEAGLPEQGFVFCRFNQSRKIARPFFDIWMRLLHQVPGSVLWLAATHPAARAQLEAAAAARGVDPARLIFAPRLKEAPAHLARHRLADLFLDTLPYNAHATACDSLWMGVPVVTCQGQAFAGRVAASLLKAAGLAELVTSSLQDYEALALTLAREPGLLQNLRQKLEEGRDHCALFDSVRFRRHIEAAFTHMAAGMAAGRASQAFAVAPLE